MSYEQFVERVEEKLKGRLDGGRTLYVREATKNNGKERKGVVFCEPGVNVSPTIYLEEYYERYRQGCSLEQVADQIMSLYSHVRMQHSWEGEFVTKYVNVRPRLIYQLISRERNRELLLQVPHFPCLDLAIVFHVLVDMKEEDRIATMLVRNEHLKWWRVTREEIYREACANTQKLLPERFTTLYAVLAGSGEEPGALEEGPEEPGGSMYVLSNCIRNFGAAAVLYRNVLKNIGKYLEEDFYVLPSSVHEVIIVPDSSAPSWQETAAIVKEINETQVREEEVLSDAVLRETKDAGEGERRTGWPCPPGRQTARRAEEGSCGGACKHRGHHPGVSHKKEEQPVKLFLFTSLTRVELAHLPPEGSALSTELQRQKV